MADPEDVAAKFDQRYGGAGYHYGTEPSAFIAAQAGRLPPGGKALVPGDGEGRHGVWLAGQGLEVTTFDPSPVGVAKARALAAGRGVTIEAEIGDFESWDWAEAEYDVVLLTYVHVPPTVRRAGHARAWRALRPGGLLILEGFSSRQYEYRQAGAAGGPKQPERLFSAAMMGEDFPDAAFLVLEDVDECFEGRTHSGRCAVLHVVAEKPGSRVGRP